MICDTQKQNFSTVTAQEKRKDNQLNSFLFVNLRAKKRIRTKITKGGARPLRYDGRQMFLDDFTIFSFLFIIHLHYIYIKCLRWSFVIHFLFKRDRRNAVPRRRRDAAFHASLLCWSNQEVWGSSHRSSQMAGNRPDSYWVLGFYGLLSAGAIMPWILQK